MPKKININERYGYWTVIDEGPSQVSPGGTSRKTYKCRCDCGTIKNVAATQLRAGRSTSCGCKGSFLKSGEQYQEWTVIEKSKYKNAHGSQFYLCKCSCGITGLLLFMYIPFQGSGALTCSVIARLLNYPPIFAIGLVTIGSLLSTLSIGLGLSSILALWEVNPVLGILMAAALLGLITLFALSWGKIVNKLQQNKAHE